MHRWVSFVLLLPALLAQANDRAEKLTTAGVEEFLAAYEAWDGVRFAAAAELFRQACTNSPNSSTHFYWLGTAQFHRLLQLQTLPRQSTNEVAADAAMKAAVAALTTAVKLRDQDAESHALLGTLYGLKIDGNLLRALRFGPSVANHQKKALEFGAENPRVRYLLGMCQFHTAKKPAELQEALRTLLLAKKLFEAEAKGNAAPLEPRWGQSSCLTFIGRSYELLGQQKEAVDYFRRALAMHPADHVAKEGLKRAAEKQ